MLRKTQIHFFPLLPWLPKQPKQKKWNEIFQNVAYRPIAYKTGEITSWSGDGARKALLFHNVCDPVFLANREMQSRFGTL